MIENTVCLILSMAMIVGIIIGAPF